MRTLTTSALSWRMRVTMCDCRLREAAGLSKQQQPSCIAYAIVPHSSLHKGDACTVTTLVVDLY